VWGDVRALLEAQPWESLEPHVLNAGAIPNEVMPRLRRYAELVLAWNRSVSNLISKNDEARIVTRHLAESLEPARLLKSSGSRRWIDFGSGAGLPAVPLSIVGIGESWALVESRRPKAIFLRRVLMEMGLSGIDAVHGRIETLTEEPSFVSAFDGVTSRATLALGPTLALAARFVAPGGVAFLWKGSGREREMEDESWREWWDFEGILGVGSGEIKVARFTRT
jgi:16S rRNA (guanine527-N7)-methyltransferase